MLRALLSIGFKIYFKIFFNLRVYGMKNFIKGPAIIAANHSSYFDPPLIGCSFFPKKVYFMARDSLFRSPLMSWGLSQCLSIPVKRGQENSAVFRKIIKLVKEGKKIALFPEGTRSENGEIQDAKEGIGLIVAKGQAPVIPIYLHGTFDAWSCHQRRPKWFGNIAVVIGKPLDFSELKGDKKELQQQITQAIMEEIRKLKSWYLDGANGCPP